MLRPSSHTLPSLLALAASACTRPHEAAAPRAATVVDRHAATAVDQLAAIVPDPIPERVPNHEEPPAALGTADALGAPRIASRRYPTWIYASPSRKGGPIGYIRPGTAVTLLHDAPAKGRGCAKSWYAVEPYGFVCDDATTTRDANDALLSAFALASQEQASTLPFRYAYSDRAPMYGRIPTATEQANVEGPPETRKRARSGERPASSPHEALATETLIVADSDVPAFLRNGGNAPSADGRRALVRKWIPQGSTLAFQHAFEAEGRTWLLTSDLRVVPADRVRLFHTTAFRGLVLAGDARLPLAWARRTPVPRYVRASGGEMRASGEPLAPYERVALSGEHVASRGRTYWETRDLGLYVSSDEVSIAQPRMSLPSGVVDQEQWVDVHTRAGTLVAYEGTRPVYATLVSPGAGGAGPAGASNADLVARSQTPSGIYRVAWKIRAAIMTPEAGHEPEKFWLSDVPWTLYFRAPFAIHTAYWHDDFGVPKSAGCINTSPADGKYLFEWAGPALPAEWQGVAPSAHSGRGAAVVIGP